MEQSKEGTQVYWGKTNLKLKLHKAVVLCNKVET